VWGLANETTSEGFLAFFAQFGEIEEGAVTFDKVTRQPRYAPFFFPELHSETAPVLLFCMLTPPTQWTSLCECLLVLQGYAPAQVFL